MNDAIDEFPGLKARTLRFTCGAPRSARAIGDGSRALFLRSDGPEDTVTSLWMSVIGSDGDTDEILLADPRTLLADADAEDVPAEEKARRGRRVKVVPVSSAIRSMRPATAWRSPSTASCS